MTINFERRIKIMKKILLIFAIFAVFLFGISYLMGEQTDQPTAQKTLKIGIVSDFTGKLAKTSEDHRNGALLAVQNSSNTVELFFEDAQADPAKSVSAARKLIDQEKVDFLIVDYSGPATAVAPVANQSQTILIYLSTVDKPAVDFEYVFKNHLNTFNECQALAEKLGSSRGAFLGSNIESNINCLNGFKTKDANLSEYFFQKDQRDFRTELLKIKAEKPSFLLTRSQNEIGLVLKQMKEIGLNDVIVVCPTISGVGCDNPTVMEEYSDLLMQAIGTDQVLDQNNSITLKFMSAYLARFGKEPTSESSFAYESVLAMDSVFSTCKNEPVFSECAKTELLNGTFSGVDGPIEFNQHGIIERRASLFQFTGEKWELLK